MDWFRGKRVALWGCGAIGGLIAEHLARAGVAELTLYDRARVTPGIMVRQSFSAADINEPKAYALARRLQSVAPAVTVAPKVENIVSRTLSSDEWDTDVDVVIRRHRIPARQEQGSRPYSRIASRAFLSQRSCSAPQPNTPSPSSLLRNTGPDLLTCSDGSAWRRSTETG